MTLLTFSHSCYDLAYQQLCGDVSYLSLHAILPIFSYTFMVVLAYRRWFVPSITRIEAENKLATEVGRIRLTFSLSTASVCASLCILGEGRKLSSETFDYKGLQVLTVCFVSFILALSLNKDTSS